MQTPSFQISPNAYRLVLESFEWEINAVKASLPSNWMHVVYMIMDFTVILLPVSLFLHYRHTRQWQKSQEDLEKLQHASQFVVGAEPVMAYPLMVNFLLRQPGNRPS